VEANSALRTGEGRSQLSLASFTRIFLFTKALYPNQHILETFPHDVDLAKKKQIFTTVRTVTQRNMHDEM